MKLKALDITKLREKKVKEGEVVQAICQYLDIVRRQTKMLDFWIQRKTGVFDSKKNTFRMRKGKYERNGISDISGIIKGGRRLEIEVKRPKPRTPAFKQCSKDQQAFLNMINANGGIAFPASSVQEVKQMLEVYVFGDKKEQCLL